MSNYALTGSNPVLPSLTDQDYSLVSSLGSYGGIRTGAPNPVFSQGQIAAPQAAGGLFDGALNKYDPMTGMTTQGWAIPALGAAQGIFNAFMGMKQYGMYKDQLAESKRQFGLNYNAQRQTTNAALSDRQNARVASNPGAYQSTEDYMAQYGIRKA